MGKRKWAVEIVSAMLAVMLSTVAMPVFAAETKTDVSVDVSDYSYLLGQQRSTGRNELYAQAEQMEDEAERKSFLIENGITDTEYSEEVTAFYSYVGGKERGLGYRFSDTTEQSETVSSYSYVAGQKHGLNYRR